MWRIYYGDGSVIADADCDPYWVPTTNVQIIWCEVPGVFSGLHLGHGFYWWDHDCWWGGDEAGLWQYCLKRGPQRVIYGTSIPDMAFMAIRDRAVKERQGWRAQHRG